MKLNRYLDTEVNAYSPICLPTKMYHNKDFVGEDVKVTGYGYTENKRNYDHDPNACKLQVGTNIVVPPEHDACKRVN